MGENVVDDNIDEVRYDLLWVVIFFFVYFLQVVMLVLLINGPIGGSLRVFMGLAWLGLLEVPRGLFASLVYMWEVLCALLLGRSFSLFGTFLFFMAPSAYPFLGLYIVSLFMGVRACCHLLDFCM